MPPVSTRDAIADAFWPLLRQKSLDKITVTDVAKACAISRQAFYYHFQTLQELIVYAIDRYISDLTDRAIKGRTPLERITISFAPAVQCPDIIRQLLASKKYPIYAILLDITMKHQSRFLLDQQVTHKINLDASEMTVRFYSGAYLCVMAGACLRERVCPSRMAEHYYRLLRGDLYFHQEMPPENNHPIL